MNMNDYLDFIPGMVKQPINRGITLSESKLLDTNPFNYENYMYRNHYNRILGLSSFGLKQRYKNLTTGFLNRYFGPTGPGYNYGGATSDFYSYTNLNGNSEVSISELFRYRMLYYETIELSCGFTFADSKSSFTLNQINKIHARTIQNAQTPGIAGIIGTTPAGSLGDRIK